MNDFRLNIKEKPKLFNMKRIYVLAIFLLSGFLNTAHANSLDFLRSTGKIYSVIVVIATLIIGLAWYLFRLESRIKKLEKTHNHGK